ncbi:hypothetical protein DBB31_22905 [Burkholderia multivorans]|nr:hypothetical protein DBB31_22905 [Burkholderia multivorans]
MRMPPMPRRTSGPRIDMSSGIFLWMAGSQFLSPPAGAPMCDSVARRLNGRMRPIAIARKARGCGRALRRPRY